MSTLYVNTLTPNSGDTVSVSGSLFVSGNITLGDQNTDGIAFGAEISSSITPDSASTYNLGSSSREWNNVYANNFIGTATTSSLAITATSSSFAFSSSHLEANGAAPSQTSITTLGVLTGLNVSGTVLVTGSINQAGVITSTGGFSGSVLDSIQPAITSVGILTTLTCSGDISSSGTVFADNFQSAGGDDTISFTDDLKLTGDMTVLGTVSSSGAITASALLTTGGPVNINVPDNNTISIGLNGATEMVFTPSASAADEKISLINTSGTADDAIKIDSVAGGLTLAAGNDSLHLDADGTDADALNIDSAGGIDIDAVGEVAIDSVGLSIDSAGVAANITSTTDGAAEDFTISLAGATDSSLILSSTGTGADALQITTTAGGIDISATGNAAGEDIDISSAASVNITATEDAANAIYLRANGGTSETIKIHSDQGTGAGSIELTSDAGSIDINSGDNITVDAADDITVTADNISMVANVTAAKIQSPTTAVTATDAGVAIPAGTAVALVNADSDANHIIILPAPVVGNIITIIENGTTGYELRTSTPASIGINGGTGANAESAIAGATTYIRCVCVSSTSWIATQFAADGTESKVEAAA